MPLNTSYTLDELRSFLLSTQRGELISRYFKPPKNNAAEGKPLRLIIDDSVHMFDSCAIEIQDAEPYLRDRYHPNTGIARLKAMYGDNWEPNLEKSPVNFYVVNTFDVIKTIKEHIPDKPSYYSGSTHYYVTSTQKWYYRSQRDGSLETINLNPSQRKYLTSNQKFFASKTKYQLQHSEIQHFLKSTNSYEFLHMGWEKQKLPFRDAQEQFAHSFIDCCYVMNQEVHIIFASHPPVIIDFSKEQPQRENLLEESHKVISKIFNVGVSRLSLPLESLAAKIDEKMNEYSKCTYVGLTREGKKLISSSAPTDVVHIEASDIQCIFLPLSNWVRIPVSERKKFVIEPEKKPTKPLNAFRAANHFDPQEQNYVPPSYPKRTQTKQNTWSAAFFSTAQTYSSTASTTHHVAPPTPTGIQ